MNWLTFLWGAGLYRNVSRTASIEALRLQLELDAMTPEQQERVAQARLERKRQAAEQAEQAARRRAAERPTLIVLWTIAAVLGAFVLVGMQFFH